MTLRNRRACTSRFYWALLSLITALAAVDAANAGGFMFSDGNKASAHDQKPNVKGSEPPPFSGSAPSADEKLCDDLASHPDDLDVPAQQARVSSEQLKKQAKQAYDACVGPASLDGANRRFVYQLGRANLALGNESVSKKNFNEAANNGSDRAKAHLQELIAAQGSAGAAGPTPSFPTKEQTVKAIAELYAGQGPCKFTSYGTSTTNFNSSSLTFDDFDLIPGDPLITFTYSIRDFWVSNAQSGGGKSPVWEVSMNPADIDFPNSRYEGKEDRGYKLHLFCKRNEYCIERNGRKLRTETIAFCDTNKRDRVYRALSHLGRLFVPSPTSPF